MSDRLTLISHALCPYVQRAAITLAEKDVPFRRVDIDLAAKPDWFLALSPLGKVPVFQVTADEAGDSMPAAPVALFESQVIVEYLEETEGHPLHPGDPLARARHRAWIEMASATLARIARLYTAPDEVSLTTEMSALAGLFRRWEDALGVGPWFGGARFGMVEAAAAPVFRYLDAFEAIGIDDLLFDCSRVRDWRARLAARPSVQGAVAPDYAARLADFLRRRNSALSRRMGEPPAKASHA